MPAIGVGYRNKMAAAFKSRALADAIGDLYDSTEVLSSVEAAYIDGVTAGTSAASKALVLDANQELDRLGKVRVTDTLVSSAQVLALNATPITVVPAPGSGVTTQFLGAYIFYDFNTAAYDTIAAGEDLVFKYTNASGVQVSQTIETTGFLDATADRLALVGPPGGDLGGVINAVANAAVVLHLLVGEVTTGDSPLKVRVFHRQVRTASLEAIA